MTEGQGKDLILGIVEGYHFHQIRCFLATLRQTDFSGHLCLFAGPGISRATIVKMRGYGAEVIEYGRRFPFISDPHPDAPNWLPARIYIFNYRHFLYLDYLLKHPGEFRTVLLTDVKDVVFQRDPFGFAVPNQLCVAMESLEIPVGKCSCTPDWIVAGYGREALERVKDKELSCAGTVLGPEPAVRAYLQAILQQVQQMRDAFECADQAAHNLMLHDGQLGPVTRFHNFEGPIATVGTEDKFAISDAGDILNKDGSAVAIVHQYDRHPHLVRMYDRKAQPSAWRRSLDQVEWLGVRLYRRAKSAVRHLLPI